MTVLSLVCFTFAGLLLLWGMFRGRHTSPQGKHALVASHMRSLESKWKGRSDQGLSV
jgi:hypothetical protein